MPSPTAFLTPAINRAVPTAAYHQVYTDLRQHIADGRVAAGERLPTISQIAKMYKVSPMTAVRALNTLAQHGLVEPRHGSGVYVTGMPLAATRVVIFDDGQPNVSFFEQLHDGLRTGYGGAAARRFDFSFLPSCQPPSTRQIDAMKTDVGTDGVAIYRPPPEWKTALTGLRNLVPAVLLLTAPRETGLDAVQSDATGPMTDALRRRLAAGKRHFAFLGQTSLVADDDDGFNTLTAMRRVFDEVLRDAGIAPIVRVGDDIQKLVAEMQPQINADWVVVTTDPRRFGLHVLETTSADVISYTESRQTVHDLSPRMTLLYQAFDLVGVAAAQLLQSRRANPTLPGRVTQMQPRLLERGAALGG